MITKKESAYDNTVESRHHLMMLQLPSAECRSGIWWGADQVATTALSKRLNTAVGEGQVLTKGRGRKTNVHVSTQLSSSRLHDCTVYIQCSNGHRC